MFLEGGNDERVFAVSHEDDGLVVTSGNGEELTTLEYVLEVDAIV